MKSTSSFGQFHLMKLSRFTEKGRRRHGVNSNQLLKGDDSTDKGAIVLQRVEYSFQNNWFHRERRSDGAGIGQKLRRGGVTSAACVSSTADRLQLRLHAFNLWLLLFTGVRRVSFSGEATMAKQLRKHRRVEQLKKRKKEERDKWG